MFKKLFLVVCLILLSVSIALSCTIPSGTAVWVFTPQGMGLGTAPGDRIVEIAPEQPDASVLEDFSNKTNEDWTDGVVVLDEEAGVYVLVHKSLLIDCE